MQDLLPTKKTATLEEAQQDMDLKSAFAPVVPRQPFFRAIPNKARAEWQMIRELLIARFFSSLQFSQAAGPVQVSSGGRSSETIPAGNSFRQAACQA